MRILTPMSRNVLRRLWAALPVRASRYKRVLAQAMDANTKALDYADRHAKAMALNAELAASELEAQAAARQAESQMAVMQRNYAEHLREQYQRFGGEPTPRVVPANTRTWEYFVHDGMPEMRFTKPGEMPTLMEDVRVQTASAEIRKLGVTIALGLPDHVPPEAIALRVGQEVSDAVLRTWRGQSALVKGGGNANRD